MNVVRPHAPIRPPRDGFVGEQVYAETWEKAQLGRFKVDTMDDERDVCLLADVIGNMPGGVTIRRAKVAATLVCWLGTNMGMAIIQHARALMRLDIDGPRAFLFAWTAMNRRVSFVNSGYRSAEHMLAPESNHGPRNAFGERRFTNPWPSADDYETLEHVAHWLGTKNGLAFIARCESEINRRQSTRGRAMAEEPTTT